MESLAGRECGRDEHGEAVRGSVGEAAGEGPEGSAEADSAGRNQPADRARVKILTSIDDHLLAFLLEVHHVVVYLLGLVLHWLQRLRFRRAAHFVHVLLRRSQLAEEGLRVVGDVCDFLIVARFALLAAIGEEVLGMG